MAMAVAHSQPHTAETTGLNLNRISNDATLRTWLLLDATLTSYLDGKTRAVDAQHKLRIPTNTGQNLIHC